MAQAKQPGRDKSLASLHKATDTLSTMLAQEVKELMKTFTSLNTMAKKNILSAIRNTDQYNLWDKLDF